MKPYIDITESAKRDAISMMEKAWKKKQALREIQPNSKDFVDFG